MPMTHQRDAVDPAIDSPRSTCILILGMHRSGTSSLTGSLRRRGLFVGEVSDTNPFNAKGNQENARVMQLNNRVLANSGGTWREPPETLVWTPELARERDDLIAFFESSQCSRWGFKDPRTLLTFAFWAAGLAQVDFVGTFRHPMAVAQSLFRRSEMPLEQGLGLWRTYNHRLVELWNRHHFPLVSFDAAESKYLESVNRAASTLGLRPVAPDSDFFEERLRHCPDASGAAALAEEDQRLYATLCRIHLESCGTP